MIESSQKHRNLSIEFSVALSSALIHVKVPAIITDVLCPDGQSKCQTVQTCCKLATGDYFCCPLPKVRNETDLTLVKAVLRGHDWVKEKVAS